MALSSLSALVGLNIITPYIEMTLAFGGDGVL